MQARRKRQRRQVEVHANASEGAAKAELPRQRSRLSSPNSADTNAIKPGHGRLQHHYSNWLCGGELILLLFPNARAIKLGSCSTARSSVPYMQPSSLGLSQSISKKRFLWMAFAGAIEPGRRTAVVVAAAEKQLAEQAAAKPAATPKGKAAAKPAAKKGGGRGKRSAAAAKAEEEQAAEVQAPKPEADKAKALRTFWA
eukprot:scaffold85446_cov18-Tisochrysis_lutea.AAC.1